MRARHAANAVVIAVILGTAACSPGPSGGAAAAASPAASPVASGPAASGGPAAAGPLHGRLRDGLLTQAQLPQGFNLNTAKIESTTTGAPHAPASTVPLASMPCSEIGVDSFMTRHAPPLEDVAVAMEQVPAVDGTSDTIEEGWFGQESIDRYAPGGAAAVMSALRDAVARCPSYKDTFVDGSSGETTVSSATTAASGDEGLVVRTRTTMADAGDPYLGETGFVRQGDVILMVQKIGAQKPPAGVDAILVPAAAAYRAAAGR
ncbi:hypothetical protein ACFWAR_08770 [Streptomyces sp. NPDC059917]|uniref:hypothetical protein n=1 Tax=Streptomyces sp. NPDC059917 TaxID=3347002 RepID=UPI003647001A